MKIVDKPWGNEKWIELNDRYCLKNIFIKKGNRTSLQYHKKKLETIYILEGRLEVWLEDEKGIITKTIQENGGFFTVLPGRKHRVVALTNVNIQEVSTPEVDDIIRVDDDFGR